VKVTWYYYNLNEIIAHKFWFNTGLAASVPVHTHTHTHTRLTALCPGLHGWAGTRKVNQSGFYWSKRQWVAVASAEPYASLHLAPDRWPRQHPTNQIFTGRMPVLPPNQQRQSTEGKPLFQYSLGKLVLERKTILDINELGDSGVFRWQWHPRPCAFCKQFALCCRCLHVCNCFASCRG